MSVLPKRPAAVIANNWHVISAGEDVAAGVVRTTRLFEEPLEYTLSLIHI